MFCNRTYKVNSLIENLAVDWVWNVMAHAQKPDFVFRRNGRVHLNRQGASVQSTTDSRGVRISGSNAGYTIFRDSVKSTGYPLDSPVSPSLPLPCVIVCHHNSTGLYHYRFFWLQNPLRPHFDTQHHYGLNQFRARVIGVSTVRKTY
jgi:hypothetical protein